jgi:ABC-2 type transport system permease protein
MKKYIQIIRSEYIHLIRSPFKTLSLSLFVLAILYSCQNGYALFKKHNIEITNIVANNEDSIAKMLDQYEEIENGTQEKTRRDPTTPYWAIWNTPSYAFKYPSPMMVFSLGQAEQYGYYKKITNWSTTFDSDMAEEIANPERLAIGTLDFNFVFIYLFPIIFKEIGARFYIITDQISIPILFFTAKVN